MRFVQTCAQTFACSVMSLLMLCHMSHTRHVVRITVHQALGAPPLDDAAMLPPSCAKQPILCQLFHT